MKDDIKHTASLVNKFFDGRTTLAEEKELGRYFCGQDIAPELAQYRDFFRYMSGELRDELKESARKAAGLYPAKAKRTKNRWFAAVAVAAVVAVLLAVFQTTRFDPYEGSYMIVGGKRSDNPELIRRQAREILSSVAEREREYREIFERSEDKTRELTEITHIDR